MSPHGNYVCKSCGGPARQITTRERSGVRRKRYGCLDSSCGYRWTEWSGGQRSLMSLIKSGEIAPRGIYQCELCGGPAELMETRLVDTVRRRRYGCLSRKCGHRWTESSPVDSEENTKISAKHIYKCENCGSPAKVASSRLIRGVRYRRCECLNPACLNRWSHWEGGKPPITQSSLASSENGEVRRCPDCVHWTPGCGLGFPDAEDDPDYANLCAAWIESTFSLSQKNAKRKSLLITTPNND